jgi:hypothetical protein
MAAFSKLMIASEGRFLTQIEEETALSCALELRQRMVVSRLIEQNEYSIVDFATQAFCNIMDEFTAPQGSARRKKGHQDGRIMLRFMAQAIREGSSEIFFEKVLSWLVGHLDERNVSGRHMEVFVHFIHQGVLRELPENLHGFVDPVFEEVIEFIRLSSHSGTIQRAHRRIADFAATRVMELLPETKAKYGASSLPKCKRDFELLVKEVARLMKAPSQPAMAMQFASWLIDRLMNQVSYEHKVWYWSFLALREGVVHCCGTEAGAAISPLFETMADHAPQLMEAVELASAAGEIANSAASLLIEMGEPLGLLRKDEFEKTVAMVNREIIGQLSAIGASVVEELQSPFLAALWCDEVLAKMPHTSTQHLAANVKALVAATSKHVSPPVAAKFKDMLMRLVGVARRTETAEKLSIIAEQLAVDVSDWATESFGSSAKAVRACYADIRLAIAHVVKLLPAGPSSVNGWQFRQYLTTYVLPNYSAAPNAMEQTYSRLVDGINQHMSGEDARAATAYFVDAMGCFERFNRFNGVRRNLEHMTVSAVERGYQAAPRHETLSRHGIEAGRRDGAFLLKKAILAAVVSGEQAEANLHSYFCNEQVRLSGLPGGVVVEFVRGLQEQMRDYPEVVQLLVGLAKAAPGYTSAAKLNAHSLTLATEVSTRVVNQAPGYREKLSETGLEACIRDNSIMIRGLAYYLQASPNDVTPMRDWWIRRIGKNIRAKPEATSNGAKCSTINLEAIATAFNTVLDHEEWEYVVDYLQTVFNPNRKVDASTHPVPSPVGSFGLPINMPSSFSDIEFV